VVECVHCGLEDEEIPASISACISCVRKGLRGRVDDVRGAWRRRVSLPVGVPGEGVECTLCANECRIPEGGRGFCGVILNDGGKLRHAAGPNKALLHYYLDPHPTNCVAGPVCPERRNIGRYNLALFYFGCNLDCLFCQNIEHKTMLREMERTPVTVEVLKGVMEDERVTCVCHFGGDPAPSSVFALRLSRIAASLGKRVCWETNGLENPSIMTEMAKLSAGSGGIVKIDWKAWSPNLYSVLTGVDGHRALRRLRENVALVSSMWDGSDPPLLVVSTLVVPHYVDEEEVGHIAEYLASLNPYIPYVLLAFHPEHLMRDVPTTSREQMERVLEAARSSGLRRVFVGNVWLLR